MYAKLKDIDVKGEINLFKVSVRLDFGVAPNGTGRFLHEIAH